MASTMKKVYSHENLAIVQTAKDLLEQQGIDSFVKNEFHGAGGHVGLEAVPIELWIHDVEQAGDAIDLLSKTLDSQHAKPGWVCDNCEEENAAAFETCWKCQRENPGLDK